MYKRDFGVLLLSVFAIYYALQHEGTFHFKKAWYHHLHEHEYLPHSDSHLPLPVVADLNGDGSAEVIVGTHDAKLQVLAPRRAARSGSGGFMPAILMSEVSVAPPSITAKEDWTPLALAAGYLDQQPVELVRAPRKQVVVVVTSNLHVLAFDHNLKLLWTKHIRESIPHASSVHEVAVHILPARVQRGDRGLVVVGYSLRLGDHSAEAQGDVFDEELRYEGDGYRRRRLLAGSGGGRGGMLEEGELGLFDDDERDFQRGVDLSRHFSYYAFEGGDGVQRWDHEGVAFHKDLETLTNSLQPQHHYRLNAQQQVAGRHFGEVSCREYRESVLRSLPHRWSRRSDTRLQDMHFDKTKVGRGKQAAKLAAGGRTAGGGPAHGAKANVLARAVGHAAKAAASGGGVRARKSDESHGATLGGANTLVAHLQEGMEAVHLFTGRTLCKLHLPAPGLHVDLNGDGVVDHIQAYGGHAPRHHTDLGHRHYGSCWAVALSGLPPREPLFNGSICAPTDLASLRSSAGDDTFVEVAAPVMLPTYRTRGGALGGIAMFLNSRGAVTAYAPHGERLWQEHVGATWSSKGGLDELAGTLPTLEALSLRVGALPTAVLAAGASRAVVISEHGHILDTIQLPIHPVLPLQVVDFNADGLNDIILISQGGFYGYAQVRHPGGSPFGALIGCLVVVMAVVYVTQQTGVSRNRRRGRSTDRTD